MESIDSAEGYECLISQYATQLRWPEVRRHALQWLSISPSNPLAHYWVSWAALQQGDLLNAIQHARALGHESPDSFPTHMLWAELHLAQGEVTAALHAIERALELAPETAVCHHVLSRVRLRRGEHPQALQAIESALRLEPDNPNYRMLHGLIQRLTTAAWTPASAAQEIRTLKQVLALDPRNPWILARIGKVYAIELFSYNHAVDFLGQSLEVDPTNVEVRHDMMEAQLRQDAIYRLLTSPLYQLRLFEPTRPHWRVPWFQLPIAFYAALLLTFGALLNLLWLWLPAQLYRHFVRADLCWSECTFRWQRDIDHRLAMVPRWLRLTGWIGATMAYWCVQFALLAIHASWIFLPAIPLGTLSLLVTWRIHRNARLALRQRP